MITVHKGNAENSETFRLIVACDQCGAHVETDVPLENMQDQGDEATEPYLARAREKLGQRCPHVQAEQNQQEKEAQPSPQQASASPQIRSSYSGGP